MPVSYSSVDSKKKGVEKKKNSLSLNKENAVLLKTDPNVQLSSVENNRDSFFIDSGVNHSYKTSDEIDPFDIVKQEKSVEEDLYGESKENKSLKRPCRDVYSNTLNAAKKLKPITTSNNRSHQKDNEKFVLTLKAPNNLYITPRPSAMLNGHHQPDLGAFGESTSNHHHNSANQKKTPIATLANLGNTCFLNSVLYTLRFAPRFLHNLHHLVTDLALVDQKLGSIRLKSSSLGRGAAGLSASGTRSWSSKDLLSLGQSDSSQCKSKIQIATERLHETYTRLYTAESRCLASSAADAAPEPYAADAFLTALRDVNSTFEGNRQQDAHELLMCVLDSIRETCRDLRMRSARLQQHELTESNHSLSQQSSADSDSASNLICTKPSLVSFRKSWKKRKEVKHSKSESPGRDTIKSTPSIPEEDVDDRSDKPGWDFVASDFEGTTVSRTTCHECEMVTERKQAMCDIGVPILEENNSQEETDEAFAAACLTSECLRDQNKYWCERCLRYNEARRSVTYETLPRLLVLQLKRFSGGMEKITRHAPTPQRLTCFCESCAHCSPKARKHAYTLWAVIVHLGQTLSGGHYVAYARRAGASSETINGHTCSRDGVERGPERSGFMRSLFARSRTAETGCGARTCCGVPTQSEDDVWFMCDDDLVTPVSQEDFDDLLSAEPKIRTAATPYVLFYVKTDIV